MKTIPKGYSKPIMGPLKFKEEFKIIDQQNIMSRRPGQDSFSTHIGWDFNREYVVKMDSDEYRNCIGFNGHYHAGLMIEFANESANDKNAYKNWQYCAVALGATEWAQCQDIPNWNLGTKYRRKPPTIKIGEYEVPEPIRIMPPPNSVCYIPNICGHGMKHHVTQYNTHDTMNRFNAGMLFETEAAAAICAKAITSFTRL